MQRKRFFILDRPCSAENVPTMIGRVVADMYEPLNEFAPWQQETRKMLEKLLPEPQISTNCQECLEFSRTPGAYAKLSKLFRVDVERQKKDSAKLKSEMIKQYTLENPARHFLSLMENPIYAADVRKLLKEKHSSRAYLVTGFLTTTNTVWEKGQILNDTHSVGVTVPIAEALGVPVPVLDVGVGVSFGDKKTTLSAKSVADEEIFAIAYSMVHLKRAIMARDFPRTAVVGGIVWAKPKHRALSGGNNWGNMDLEDDDEDDSEASDEEELFPDEVSLAPEIELLGGKFDDVIEIPSLETI